MRHGQRNTHRHAPLAPVAWGLALFVSLLGLSACDESVSPIIESDQRFTLFATLDMNRDTQYVRVVRIRDVVVADEDLDGVQVRSVDLTHGTTVTWNDSLVEFLNGSMGHVFWAPLRLQPRHRYRVEIVEDGSAVTWAETLIPAIPSAIVEPEVVETFFTTDLRGQQRILWQGLDRDPYDVQHWYRFLDFGLFSFVDIPLADNLRHTGFADDDAYPDAFEVKMNLVADRVALDTLINLNGAALAGMGMTITVLDGQFVPPGGTFDRVRLAQPGTMSNVVGGFGFVGSVGRFSVEWVLRDTSVQLLRYKSLSTIGLSVPQAPAVTLPGHPVIRGLPARREDAQVLTWTP